MTHLLFFSFGLLRRTTTVVDDEAIECNDMIQGLVVFVGEHQRAAAVMHKSCSLAFVSRRATRG